MFKDLRYVLSLFLVFSSHHWELVRWDVVFWNCEGHLPRVHSICEVPWDLVLKAACPGASQEILWVTVMAQHGYQTIVSFSIQSKTINSQVPPTLAQYYTGASIAYRTHWEPRIWDPGQETSSRLGLVGQSTFSGVRWAFSVCLVCGILEMICKCFQGDRGWLTQRTLLQVGW